MAVEEPQPGRGEKSVQTLSKYGNMHLEKEIDQLGIHKAMKTPSDIFSREKNIII